MVGLSKSESGYSELSFTKVFIFIVMFLCLVAGVIWSMAYYEEMKVITAIKETIYRNRNVTEDDALAELIVASMKISPQIQFDPKDVMVNHSADGKTVRVHVSYNHVVKIPFTSYTWDIHFAPDLEEDLSRTFI